LKPAIEVTPFTDGDLLNTYLADRDVPCPRCGYNLRGLSGRRCPECGDELTLRIGLVEPRMTAYLTALGASCAGVGGSGLFTALAMSVADANWWRETSAKLLLVLLVVASAMLALALWKRRRFRAAPIAVQWTLAGAACLIVATLSVLVVALFRD
jgi:hypothetical protein